MCNLPRSLIVNCVFWFLFSLVILQDFQIQETSLYFEIFLLATNFQNSPQGTLHI